MDKKLTAHLGMLIGCGRMAIDVKEKRCCRATLQDMATILGRPVSNNEELYGTKEAALAAGKAMNDAHCGIHCEKVGDI